MTEAGENGPAPDGLADVIAYLERKRANAGLVAGRSPEFAELARDRARQLEIMIDELKAGLHQGEAAVSLMLSAGSAEEPGSADAAADEGAARNTGSARGVMPTAGYRGAGGADSASKESE